MDKDRTAKNATEMTYEEFVAWSSGYILFGIGEGRKLKDLVEVVVNQSAQNTVFGGGKKQ